MHAGAQRVHAGGCTRVYAGARRVHGGCTAGARALGRDTLSPSVAFFRSCRTDLRRFWVRAMRKSSNVVYLGGVMGKVVLCCVVVSAGGPPG